MDEPTPPPPPPRDDRPRVRNPRDYPNYPTSSRFLWHGAGKDYYKLWHEFLVGATDEEPPSFDDFVEEWRKQFEPFRRTKRFFSSFRRKDEKGNR